MTQRESSRSSHRSSLQRPEGLCRGVVDRMNRMDRMNGSQGEDRIGRRSLRSRHDHPVHPVHPVKEQQTGLQDDRITAGGSSVECSLSAFSASLRSHSVDAGLHGTASEARGAPATRCRGFLHLRNCLNRRGAEDAEGLHSAEHPSAVILSSCNPVEQNSRQDYRMTGLLLLGLRDLRPI